MTNEKMKDLFSATDAELDELKSAYKHIAEIAGIADENDNVSTAPAYGDLAKWLEELYNIKRLNKCLTGVQVLKEDNGDFIVGVSDTAVNLSLEELNELERYAKSCAQYSSGALKALDVEKFLRKNENIRNVLGKCIEVNRDGKSISGKVLLKDSTTYMGTLMYLRPFKKNGELSASVRYIYHSDLIGGNRDVTWRYI